MKAESLTISKVFSSGGDVLYLLPYFQREYAWSEQQWKTLLEDIGEVYDEFNDNKRPEHFMGALVVVNDGTFSGVISRLTLVDGQQRLTTISLFLCALRDIVELTDRGLATKISRLLTNQDEDGDQRLKLLPTEKYGDRAAYSSLILREGLERAVESHIPHAYEYMKAHIESGLQSGRYTAERLYNTISICLQVVFITIERIEKPYEIFESLNAKGKTLTQADLVRNYIAMKLPESEQAYTFKNLWSPIEERLQEKRSVGSSRLGELTAFVRHYLAYRSGVLCSEEHVYARFRDRIEEQCGQDVEAFKAEIATLKRFSVFYDRFLRPETEPDQELRQYLVKVNTYEVATAYPFLLGVYEHYTSARLTRDELIDTLRSLENYIVRRYLAGESTNYLNKVFPSLWREIHEDRFVPSLQDALATKNYPSDQRILSSVLTRPLYDRSTRTQRKTVTLLGSLEDKLSEDSDTTPVLKDSPTIEHVMPQTLSSEWVQVLGDDAERIHREKLNTLGNLTLVLQSWNSQISNSGYEFKRRRLLTSGLRLNQYFDSEEGPWSEGAVDSRGQFLAELALEQWPSFARSKEGSGGTAYRQPIAVHIRENVLEAFSWRQAAVVFTQHIIDHYVDLETVTTSLPRYFSHTKPFRGYQVTDDWWLNVNLSSSQVVSLCTQLARLAGLTGEEWFIDYR